MKVLEKGKKNQISNLTKYLDKRKIIRIVWTNKIHQQKKELKLLKPDTIFKHYSANVRLISYICTKVQ